MRIHQVTTPQSYQFQAVHNMQFHSKAYMYMCAHPSNNLLGLPVELLQAISNLQHKYENWKYNL
jgi:hypothetical protein